MVSELNNDVKTKGSNLFRALTFTLLGILVCLTLYFTVFERQEEQKATAISTPTAEMLPGSQSPLQEPGNETTVPLTRTRAGNLLSNDSEIVTIKPFKPDVFFSNAIGPDTRRERPSIRANSKISEEDGEEDEESKTGKRGGPLKSSKKVKAGYPNEAVIFRNLQLKDENGKIPLDGMEKAREHLREMQAEQQRLAIGAGKPDGLKFAGIEPGDWAWQGPGNIGGRMRSIVIHPTDPTKMWVGSVGGGIWKTTNAGTAWSPVNDFMANLAVSTMVIDPTNPNIMYAGTGEGLAFAEPVGDALQGDGIFKTTDGGATWNQLPSTKVTDPLVCPVGVPCPWTYVNRLAISPDGTTILAATFSAIRRSTDGGATWSMVTANTARSYADIDFDPTNSQLAVAGSDGITTYSTDGGQTWLTAGYPTPGTTVPGRSELAYAPSSPNIVYASINQNGGEVYLSINGGQTFNIVNTGIGYLASQGYYDNIIWVNPQDPTFVLIGGVELWRSTNSGQNFAQISNSQSAPTMSAHADHHMIVAHPGFNNTTNKTVFFGNDGGIYRTNDVSTVAQTTGWTNLNNSLGITQFYGAAGNSAGVIIGGTQDNGSLRSASNPNTWTSTVGGDGGFVAADPTDTNYFYTEYINLGLQRSTNGGTSASYIYCNPAPTNPNGGPCVAPAVGITDAFNGANFIAPFILDPNEPNRLLAGGTSLWRSNDIKAAGLPTWAAIKGSILSPISAIAVAQGNSNFIVVGHLNGRIFLTQDGTAVLPNWGMGIDVGTPARYVTRIAIDETRLTPWIYATFGGFSADNVWCTKDLGVTWTDVTGSGITGLPDVPVRSIVINPARQDQLYVGTEIGIFASEDAGATWALPQDGPANVSVDELFWNRGQLVAATHGRGIYKTTAPVFSSPGACQPYTGCSCAGQWSCACTWPDGGVPTTQTDVVVSCPMSVGNGVAKSLRVNSDLRLGQFSQLSISGDILNFGVLAANPITGGLITARNVTNGPSGTLAVKDLDVTGDVLNGGMMMISNVLEASRHIETTQNSTLTAGRIYAGGNFLYYSTNPLVLTTTLQIGGNLHNQGRIQGTSIGQVANYAGGFVPQTYSGPGVLKFNGAGSGTNLTLANDKTFEVGSFYVSGPLNLGTNSMAVTDNIAFQGTGAVTGTGTIFLTPRTGVDAAFSYNNASFTPTIRMLSGTYVVPGASNLIGAPLIIDAGATLALNWSNLTTEGDVTVNGRITTTGTSSGFPTFYFNGTTFTNNGEVSNIAGQYFVFGFNQSITPRSQVVTGTGAWSPTELYFGAGQGGATTVTLMNDMTFSGSIFSTKGQFSSFNIGANTLTHTGSSFGGTVNGTGTIRMQPVSGTTTFSGIVTPGMKIVSGTVSTGSSSVGGPLVIDSGAALSLTGSFFARGDVTVNGTIGQPSGIPVFYAVGNGTILNNGSVGTDVWFGPTSGTPVLQNLGGAGTWGGTGRTWYLMQRSVVTLLNDVTFGGSTIWVESPGVRMNTGAFTFSLPCNTVWQSTGEISGNIRRTNLAACPGSTLTFGNPFTTIQFTSGTPPTDIRVDTSSVAPLGFPNAVRRSYQITPTGGSGYAATLRLRYFDSELNGNSESTLQLWRHDGSAWTAQGATARDTANNWVQYAGVTQFSPWAISGLAPTAAEVSISGRVTTADGRSIRNVRVSLTDQSGNVRSALTNAFGYYRFDGIEAGQTVVISVAAKRYVFASPTRIVTVQEELADIDFTAEP